MKKLPVFLVGNYTVLLDGLELLINSQPDLQVIGRAKNNEIDSKVAGFFPNVFVKDTSEPAVEIFINIEKLKRTSENTKILLITVEQNASYLDKLDQSNISAYLPVNATGQDLIRAIRGLATNIYTNVGNMKRTTTNNANIAKIGQSNLTEREETVLRLLAWGYINKEIAASLNLSIKTIETYKVRSMEKLSLRNRVDIVKYALHKGWLESQPEISASILSKAASQ